MTTKQSRDRRGECCLINFIKNSFYQARSTLCLQDVRACASERSPLHPFLLSIIIFIVFFVLSFSKEDDEEEDKSENERL